MIHVMQCVCVRRGVAHIRAHEAQPIAYWLQLSRFSLCTYHVLCAFTTANMVSLTSVSSHPKHSNNYYISYNTQHVAQVGEQNLTVQGGGGLRFLGGNF